MCIKYFKNLSKLIYIILYIVEKYLKYVSKKKNIEHFFDLNKINERILSVCSKIEQLDQNLNKNQQDIDNNSDKVCPMDICNSFNNSTYSTNNNIYFNISSLYTSNKEGWLNVQYLHTNNKILFCLLLLHIIISFKTQYIIYTKFKYIYNCIYNVIIYLF